MTCLHSGCCQKCPGYWLAGDSKITEEEHRGFFKALCYYLEDAVADYIEHERKTPESVTLCEFLRWAERQIVAQMHSHSHSMFTNDTHIAFEKLVRGVSMSELSSDETKLLNNIGIGKGPSAAAAGK